MYLEPQERALFFKLYFDLLYCVNAKHKIAKKVADGRFPKRVEVQQALKVRDKLFENPKWIDEYLLTYGDERTAEERDILISWRDHFIKNDFFVMRNYKKYTVFMTPGDKAATRLYGVVGLNHPVSVVFETGTLPLIVQALLLPFKNVIVYDGMLTSHNVYIGPNMRNELNGLYKISKDNFGVIETLPFDDSSVKKTVKVQKASNKQTKVPEEKIEEISSIITEFCDTYLNSEYAEMSLKLLGKLRRKRPSPLLSGRVNTWAAGIVYAIGSVNFLFDKSQTPHMRAAELASHFGISQSTAGNKSGEIFKICDLTQFDPEWTLPGKLADNPLVWMFEREDGYIFDARNAPREVQEKLLKSGLIPFIP